MATEITEEVKKSIQLYRDYSGGSRNTWANQCVQDRAFKSGAQISNADQEIYDSMNQVAPITNELIPTIDSIVEQLTSNSPRFFAVGRERSDNKVAGAVADTMSYVWYISKGDEYNEMVATDFEDVGMGIWMAYIDPFADNGKGEIKLCAIDPLDVYVSPTSKDPNCQDSPHILIVKNMTDEVLKSTYPNINIDEISPVEADEQPTHDRNTPQDQRFDTSSETTQKKYRIIDRYTKVKEKRFHVFDPNSNYEAIMKQDQYIQWSQELAVIAVKFGQENYFTERSQVEELVNVARTQAQYNQTADGFVYHYAINPETGQPEIVPGFENSQDIEPTVIPNSTTNLKIVTRADLLKLGVIKYNTPFVDRIQRVFSIGDKEIYNGIMEDKKGALEDYPIVFIMLHWTRNPYPQGDIRLVKSLQEQLNKIDNLIITYNQNITNVKGFVPRGSGLKKELDKTGSVAGSQWYEFDPELGGQPIIVQLTAMSNSLYQQRENLIRQIQRIVGAYAFEDSNLSTPRTMGGTDRMDEFMQRRTARKKRKLERGLNQLGKVVSQMIPMVYDERKIIRVIKPNHKPKETILNEQVIDDNGEIKEILNDVTNSRYDIQVVSGSMLPTNKAQARNELMTAYQNGMLKDPRWWIEKTEFDNIDEMIEVESTLRQSEQVIQQMQQQMKDLQGALQRKSNEVIQANEKVIVMKETQGMKDISSQLKASVELTKQRLSDHEKNEKKKQTVSNE